MQHRTLTLFVSGRCELSCPTCDCRVAPTGSRDVERGLCGPGKRIVLRGVPALEPNTIAIVRRARSEGAAEITLRTNALAYADAERSAKLAELGIDSLIVPLFSH